MTAPAAELDDEKDSKFEVFAEVKSGSEDGIYPPRSHKVYASFKKEPEPSDEYDVTESTEEQAQARAPYSGMMVQMPGIEDLIPLAIMFRVLRVVADDRELHSHGRRPEIALSEPNDWPLAPEKDRWAS
jgi:hypothetical protein